MSVSMSVPATPVIEATASATSNLIDLTLLPEELRAKVSQYLKIQEKINLFSQIHETIRTRQDPKHILFNLRFGYNKYNMNDTFFEFDFIRRRYLKGLCLTMTKNNENVVLNGNFYRASLKLVFNLLENRIQDDEGNIKIQETQSKSVLKNISPRTYKMLIGYDKKILLSKI